jgi:hypothetical protein
VTTHVDHSKSRDQRPGRVLRWLLRLPVRLYRPALRVVLGRTTFVPSHRALTEDDAVSVMAHDERRNRLAAQIVRMALSRLTGWSYDGSEAARRLPVSQCPLVAFQPSISATGS